MLRPTFRQLVSGSLPIYLHRISLRKPLTRHKELPMLVHAVTANVTYEFAADVRAGLTKPGQKELLSKYLYDDVGSALFEVICHLPEYGLHARRRALAAASCRRYCRAPRDSHCHRGARQRQRQEDSPDTRAFCRRQRTRYYPIEISRARPCHVRART